MYLLYLKWFSENELFCSLDCMLSLDATEIVDLIDVIIGPMLVEVCYQCFFFVCLLYVQLVFFHIFFCSNNNQDISVLLVDELEIQVTFVHLGFWIFNFEESYCRWNSCSSITFTKVSSIICLIFSPTCCRLYSVAWLPLAFFLSCAVF